jgi:hypothetical protein
MNRYEEQVYRLPKKEKLTLKQLKSQLLQCQNDMEGLKEKPSAGILRASLAERIRGLQLEIRQRTQESLDEKARAAARRGDPEDGGGPSGTGGPYPDR